jgi:hypothetical protein
MFLYNITTNICIIWLTIIPLLYSTLINIFNRYNLYQNTTINNNKETTIVSHILSSLICVTYLSINGIILFIENSEFIVNKDYLFKENENIINYLIIPMMVYQFYNIIIMIFNKDLYSINYIIHHIFVILSGLIALDRYLQYFIIIYFGIIEISNIFLSIIDYGKYEKSIIENKKFITTINILFAISFFITRILIFQYFNYNVIKIMIEEHKILFSEYFIYTTTILLADITLSYLQFYWGYLIYNKIIKEINNLRLSNKLKKIKN